MNIIDANNNEKTLARALTLTQQQLTVQYTVPSVNVQLCICCWCEAMLISLQTLKTNYHIMHVSDSINEINANVFHYDLHAKNRARAHAIQLQPLCTEHNPFRIAFECVFVLILTEDTIWRTGPKPGIKRTVTANKNENTESNWN